MKVKKRVLVLVAAGVTAVGVVAGTSSASATTSPALAAATVQQVSAGQAQSKGALSAAVGFVTSTARHLASTKAVRQQVSNVAHLGSIFDLRAEMSRSYGEDVDKAFDR